MSKIEFTPGQLIAVLLDSYTAGQLSVKTDKTLNELAVITRFNDLLNNTKKLHDEES